MQYLVKQAVCLEGKDYLRGVHELSGATLQNETFKRYLKLGLIVKQAPAADSEIEPIAEENSKKSKKQK